MIKKSDIKKGVKFYVVRFPVIYTTELDYVDCGKNGFCAFTVVGSMPECKIRFCADLEEIFKMSDLKSLEVYALNLTEDKVQLMTAFLEQVKGEHR